MFFKDGQQCVVFNLRYEGITVIEYLVFIQEDESRIRTTRFVCDLSKNPPWESYTKYKVQVQYTNVFVLYLYFIP